MCFSVWRLYLLHKNVVFLFVFVFFSCHHCMQTLDGVKIIAKICLAVNIVTVIKIDFGNHFVFDLLEKYFIHSTGTKWWYLIVFTESHPKWNNAPGNSGQGQWSSASFTHKPHCSFYSRYILLLNSIIYWLCLLIKKQLLW